MTTPDRPEDLVRRMLERRSGSPAPGWLRASVAESVGRTRQVRRGSAWAAPLDTRAGRLALVAAAIVVLLAVTLAVLVASGLLEPEPPPTPSQPAIVADPSPSAIVAPPTPESSTSPDPTSTDAGEPTAAPVVGDLAPDTIAVVSRQGDGLRVRSIPSLGAASEKLTPLLKTGSRMLVVDGPISADGYDWYEVMADNDLFGWVATGKDGDWIERAEPRCTDDLDEPALWTVSPIDFLVCYGDAQVDVRALSAEPMGIDTGPAPPCKWADVAVPCKATPRWLFEPFSVVPVAHDERLLAARARPAVQDRLGEMPPVAFVTLTMAMDNPQAADCRVVDGRGRDLIARDEAVTRCRMQFVITDLAWDPAMALPRNDGVARVLPAVLPVYSAPGGERLERGLLAGDEVLVVDDPRIEAGVPWFAVIPRRGMGWPAGWVAFLVDDRPALAPVDVSCPATDDWRAIHDLDVGGRVTCFGTGQKLTFTTKVVSQPAGSNAGACSTYDALTQTAVPCVADPAWLTSATGLFLVGAEGVEGAEFWVDPRKVDPSSVPQTTTVMRVTGSFSHRDALKCEVRNPDTGESLVWDLSAQAYCRSHFVVTKLAPAP